MSCNSNLLKCTLSVTTCNLEHLFYGQKLNQDNLPIRLRPLIMLDYRAFQNTVYYSNMTNMC